jgi:AhpD family alkylhydroperoxidase
MSDVRIAPAPAATSDPDRALEARILETRGSISALYAVLLNSPPVADGWERLLTAIRQKMALPPRLRELAILRIAVLNGADYEFDSHIPHALRAGVSAAEIGAVKDPTTEAFKANDRLVLDYTDAMTRDVRVSDQLFANIQSQFDARGCVELTATIAAYNMVSRFLVALDVH